MIATLQCIVLDCPDVHELARFYRSLLGGTVNQPDPRWAVDDDFSTLHPASGPILGFQRVRDHRPPRWPDSAYPQQFHLDLEVPDIDRAQEQVLALGATPLHTDPRGWTILADPAGHPFCLLKGPSSDGR
ncbi:VOC family protein [Streptomyces radicis]|uniref:VOC family protein n=1 Tax=Streptomyces radicis TaxID=1750517 RepID=A0A3A9W6R8_9ACTN|nr:VOC family protein [Streptomyces radicis]RKN08402.1 VOC family protein [Streptomyces radicis]RKN21563.1 VOC family protein [Streptomyces radicis]